VGTRCDDSHGHHRHRHHGEQLPLPQYPTVDPDELVENLFPKTAEKDATTASPITEETVVAVPRAQLHLINPNCSLEVHPCWVEE
jgi:hypothetical protein